MLEHLNKFYIDGQWIEPNSEEQFALTNPATEQEVGHVVLGNQQDVEQAVAAAKRAFDTYGLSAKHERIQLLESLLARTKERMEDLAQAMTLEMGSPITFSREMQADAAIGHLESFIDLYKRQHERESLGNGDTLLREPIGVCGLITPWNWPINQIVLKVVPALATGCTCVLKPSEYTPLSAVIYAEIIEASGFPPGVFNLVQGAGTTVGAALSAHP